MTSNTYSAPPVVTNIGEFVNGNPFPYFFDCGGLVSFGEGDIIQIHYRVTDPDDDLTTINIINGAGHVFGSNCLPVLPLANPPSGQKIVLTWTPNVAPIVGTVRIIAFDAMGNFDFCDFFYDIALPVELASFVSVINGNDVTLKWKTSSEIDNAGFEIERANVVNGNSAEWRMVGFVPGNGTSTEAIEYIFKDRELNAGTYNYRLRQMDFNGNSEYHNLNNDVVIQSPTTFDLKQNYPNPFNPVTKIDYEIPFDGNVNLSVYDNSGKLMSVIYRGFKPSGYYSETFNASDLSSGVYLYKLEYHGDGQSFSKVMKMIVVK